MNTIWALYILLTVMGNGASNFHTEFRMEEFPFKSLQECTQAGEKLTKDIVTKKTDYLNIDMRFSCVKIQTK